ncbi:putative zinc knuckle transcription factor protein [Erysiphe necator]|uniref:Putative zinc knuckle transcription factor protein n=1 Tax=Uncinula necator TaxID=52586 RepID=A0A0B1PDD5_UNCNE|nr:putative zinc knuckle transcription factor protein [Erysiphe necator]
MSWDFPTAADAHASEWETQDFDTYGGTEDKNNGKNCEEQGYAEGGGDGDYGGGGDGEWYGCEETGENCQNQTPREFTGNCRICDEQGHRANECPNKPATICRNCQEEGHEAFGCTRPRKINRDHIQDKTVEEAWKLINDAVEERDLDDLKDAIEIYIKAEPETTYQQLEKKFRDSDMGVYIIALEKELATTYTNMDFQGCLDKTYSITWRWSPKPMRPKEIPSWPNTPEENFERLADAGEPTDRGIPKCSNCNTLGHTRRRCPEQIVENPERTTVLCFNCNKTGHRMRDCPDPRVDRLAEHKNEDSGENALTCRNCDAEGHISKECPLPRDYSRIKCQNCEQMGHTKVRCTEPLKEAEYGDGDYAYGANTGSNEGQDQNYSGGYGADGWDTQAGDQGWDKPNNQSWDKPSNQGWDNPNNQSWDKPSNQGWDKPNNQSWDKPTSTLNNSEW